MIYILRLKINDKVNVACIIKLIGQGRAECIEALTLYFEQTFEYLRYVYRSESLINSNLRIKNPVFKWMPFLNDCFPIIALNIRRLFAGHLYLINEEQERSIQIKKAASQQLLHKWYIINFLFSVAQSYPYFRKMILRMLFVPESKESR